MTNQRFVRRARGIARSMLIALAMSLCTSLAAAHVANLSTARISRLGDQLVLELEVNLRDVEAKFGTGRSTAEIAIGLLPFAGIIAAGKQPCTSSVRSSSVAGEHLKVASVWRCPAGVDLTYRSTLWHDLDPAARQIVIIAAKEGPRQAVIDSTRTEVTLEWRIGSLFEVALRFVDSGVEHIFLGYDHIAFLIAIVLWSRRLWPLVKIVTAFTLAHSVTLSLAATGVMSVPEYVLEPLIAATIALVAIENFFSRDVGRRWATAFGFGLIHGFGFAGALREFGLPQDVNVTALAAFNIGVELGQIAILLILLPLLIGLERTLLRTPRGEASPRLVTVASALILALGIWWLIDRLDIV